jgi:hypothetical protein
MTVAITYEPYGGSDVPTVSEDLAQLSPHRSRSGALRSRSPSESRHDHRGGQTPRTRSRSAC